MNREKKFKISNKVFNESDIRSLWYFVTKKVIPSLPGTASITIKNDAETISYDDDAFFETINYCRKNINMIEIKYKSSDYRSSISIIIEATHYPMTFFSNYVEVRSCSEEWVDACYSQLHEIIKYVAEPSRSLQILRKWNMIILAILTIILSICFFVYVLPFIFSFSYPTYIKLAITILYFCFNIMCLEKFIDLTESLPLVVIDVNGNYQENRKKLSSIIWKIIGDVIIPVILSVTSILLTKR